MLTLFTIPRATAALACSKRLERVFGASALDHVARDCITDCPALCFQITPVQAILGASRHRILYDFFSPCFAFGARPAGPIRPPKAIADHAVGADALAGRAPRSMGPY